MYTDFAVFIGLTYSYLPFMILPLYATLERMDLDLIEAAQDLGASRTRAFWDITVPLAKPGIIAGCMLVFIPAIGEYVIPYLLGGPESLLIGRVLFDEFFINRDWPLASAVAIVLLLLLVIPIVILQRNQAKDSESAA
jgi:putrescine transport system permease protein